jgi:hypothetical protein
MITLTCPLSEADLPAAARPRIIRSDDEARAWLTALVASGASWHPEDDASEVGNLIDGAWVRTFDDDLASRLNDTMSDVWYMSDVEPCSFILALEAPALTLARRS